MNMLLCKPQRLKAGLFCGCKRKKFIGQNKVKFVNYKVKILGQKLVARVITHHVTSRQVISCHG